MPITIERLLVSDKPRLNFDIYVQGKDWKSDVSDFIADLQDSDFNKLYGLLGRYAEYGPINKTELFKPLKDYTNVYEFITWGVRAFCHIDGRRVVLTEACYKRATKASAKVKQCYKRADQRKDAYFRAKAEGTLEVKG